MSASDLATRALVLGSIATRTLGSRAIVTNCSMVRDSPSSVIIAGPPHFGVRRLAAALKALASDPHSKRRSCLDLREHLLHRLHELCARDGDLSRPRGEP